MNLTIKRTFESENNRTTLTFTHSPLRIIGQYPSGRLVFGNEGLVPGLQKDDACIYQMCAVRESDPLESDNDVWLYLQSLGRLGFKEMEFVSLYTTSQLLTPLFDSQKIGNFGEGEEFQIGQRIIRDIFSELEKNIRIDALLEFLKALVPFRYFIKDVSRRAGEEYVCIDISNRKVQLRDVSFSQKAGELFEQLLFTGTDNLNGNLSMKEFGEHIGQYYEHIAKRNTRERNDIDKKLRDWYRQYIKKVPA